MKSTSVPFCRQLQLVAVPLAVALSIGVSNEPFTGLAAGAVIALGLWLARR